MKSLKKIAKFSALAVGILTLAACTNEEPTVTETKELTVSVGTDYIDYINEVKSAFESEHDVTVTVVEKDAFEQMDALPLDGPSDLGPDVTMSPFDRVGQGGAQGYLAQISLPDDGRFTETDEQQVSFDGKTYGQPAMVESLVLYYNRDLISEAPTTFEELEELAKDDQYKDGDYNVGFLAKWTDLYFSYGLIAGNGGYVFGEDGSNPQDIGLDNEGAIEGITYATEWYQNVWPAGMLDVTANSNLILDYFTSGKTAAIISGPWDANNFKEAGLNYGVAKIPTLPNGNDYESFSGGKAWVVSNFSKNKELSEQFVTYLTNKENQLKLYEMRSDIPVNVEAQAEIAKSDDELTKAVIEQYAVSHPMPNIPEMAEVWAGAQNMFFDAGSGNMTPEESAQNAVQTIKESIEQKH